MAEEQIYTKVLDYMCENFDYSLYATDFDAKSVAILKNTIASVPTSAGNSRTEATKTALQDFFDAIFQKVFVYEDEERLKIVKYFDKGAINEDEDKQIHALRQELVKYKEEVANTFSKDSLYMFNKASRKRFETALISLNEIPLKEILRDQISLVYDLEKRDIVVFLNGKIFMKKFNYHKHQEETLPEHTDMFYDKRFIDSLWEEVRVSLIDSFKSGFDFLKYDAKEFYVKYPPKFFHIITMVVKESFVDISENEATHYAHEAFKSYLPKILKVIAQYILHEVIENNLKAIKFLKQYSESTKISNNKMKLNKAPLMDKKGKIYNYNNILSLLKLKELTESKITHKKIEIKNIQVKVKKSLFVVQRSEDEMERIQKRRLELLLAIEKVDDEINSLDEMNKKNNLTINRLEFSKRDLLDAFKQVEVRSRTQTNILNNANRELNQWEEKKAEKSLLKEDLFKKQMEIEEEYSLVCDILAIALSKEPLEF